MTPNGLAKNRLASHMLLTMLLMMMALVTTVIYWSFWPFQIIKINQFKVFEDSVASGSYLVYRLDYCKNPSYRSVPAVVQYSYVGAIAHLDTPSYSVIGQGVSLLPSGCSFVEEALRVPMIPSGTYRLEMIRIYHVNAMRDVVIRTVSNPFVITSRVSILQRENDELRRELRELVEERKSR